MIDYQSYFQTMRQETNTIVIVFFKTFQKIVIIPERLNQFLSWHLKLEKDFLEFESIAYSYTKHYATREDSESKELNVRYTALHHYDDIVGLVTYKSEALVHSTILTAKDFNKVTDKINDEIEAISERLVRK